jgi:hypothetical protein
LDGALFGFVPLQAELGLEMDVRGAQECMNSGPLGILNGFPALIDISRDCARQAGNNRPTNLASDRLHGGEIVGARGRETGFDHVNPELGQLLRHRQLLG